jgi:CHAT domain-containing protein
MATFRQVLRLAQQRRFPEAALLALQVGETALRRGFRDHAFDAFGAAGKFFQMAAAHDDALDAFGRAFTLLEHDLSYLPQAGFVVGRLAEWPELYTRAAVAALGAGDPEHAIDLAEAGRTRLIAHRVGPGAQQRPSDIPPEMWLRYATAWRKAVARQVGSLLGAAREEDATLRALEGELTRLRGEFLAQGVDPQELVPVVHPLQCADARQLLAVNPRNTAVLFAVRLDNCILHLIRLTAAGAEHIELEKAAQTQILQAVDRYGQALRVAPAQRWALLQSELPILFRSTRDLLGQVLSRVLADRATERLVWIPHGNLVHLPLLAYPCGDGMVIDRVAVLTAPSLTFGRDALDSDHELPGTCTALRGRYEGDEASTEGGECLLTALPRCQVQDSVPAASDELEQAVRDRSLILLTCHGLYDWGDPLATRLKLGGSFDLSVETLFDTRVFGPDALVVLGACDSGTVAQGEINEALGIPVGLLAAGARTVVGAAWPVPHLTAVGVCHRLLQGLAGGSSTPEALRAAIRWIRDVSWGEYRDALQPTGHPIAAELAPLMKRGRQGLPLHEGENDLALWAPYMHWGGGAHLSPSG